MKRKIIFLICVVMGLSCLSGFANAEKLVGRINDWAPLYYQENGKWTGISVEAYEALTKEAGIELELRVLPWSRAMKAMETEPIMIANLTPTEERKKTMHFIGPHHDEVMGLAVAEKDASEKINSLDDLVQLIKKTGLKVAYQQDTQFSEEFNNRLKDVKFASNFYKMANTDNTPTMVIRGRLLGYLETRDSLAYRLKTVFKNSPIVIHPYYLSKTKVYVGVSRTISASTLKKLQEANERLIANGTWDRLIKKWSTTGE